MKPAKMLLVLALAAVIAAPLLTVGVYAADNDNNNIRCTGDPHDDKDSGNAHEPPNSDGNPHFCPPIGKG